jgi:hypothetical protein
MDTKEAIEKGFQNMIDLVNRDFDLIDETVLRHMNNQLKLTRATLVAQLRNTRDAIIDVKEGNERDVERGKVYITNSKF